MAQKTFVVNSHERIRSLDKKLSEGYKVINSCILKSSPGYNNIIYILEEPIEDWEDDGPGC